MHKYRKCSKRGTNALDDEPPMGWPGYSPCLPSCFRCDRRKDRWDDRVGSEDAVANARTKRVIRDTDDVMEEEEMQ